MKKVFAFTVLVAALMILTLSGCATYSAKGVMPNLNDPSTLVAKDKLVTKAEEGIKITVYPVTNEDEVKKFFDEDLLDKNILPVAVRINSTTYDVLSEIYFIPENGRTIPPFSSEYIYDKYIKRDVFGKGAFWWFFGLYVGAPISAYHSYKINEEIKKDLGVEGNGGKLLKLGKIPDEGLSGFFCFKVPKINITNEKIRFVFQRDDKSTVYDLDLK